MTTCNLYYGYLQSTTSTLKPTMYTCTLLWLRAITMATCSLLCVPVVYYDYSYSLPSVLPSLLYTATLLCLPSLHYNSFCAA